MKKCPFCAKDIQDQAVVCRYCRRDIDADPGRPIGARESGRQPGAQVSRGRVILVVAIGAILAIGAIALVVGMFSSGAKRYGDADGFHSDLVASGIVCEIPNRAGDKLTTRGAWEVHRDDPLWGERERGVCRVGMETDISIYLFNGGVVEEKVAEIGEAFGFATPLIRLVEGDAWIVFIRSESFATSCGERIAEFTGGRLIPLQGYSPSPKDPSSPTAILGPPPC